MRDSISQMYTLINTNMRYNPRTDNALSMDEIAKQCMDAVIKATTPEDSRFTARGPGSVGEPWCKLQPLF